MKHGFFVTGISSGPEVSSDSNTAQAVLALFAGDRAGAIWDTSYLPAMFSSVVNPQAGSVNTSGQNVGLMLDGKYGYKAGDKLSINETFDSSGQGWVIIGTGGASTLTFLNPGVRFVAPTTDAPILTIRSNISLVTGQWYEITVTISQVNSPGQLRIGSYLGTNVPAVVGTHKILWKASSANLDILRTNAGVDSVIASVQCRPLPGHHLEQSDSTKRPLYVVESSIPRLRFNGANSFLSVNGLNWPMPMDRISGLTLSATVTDNRHIFGDTGNRQILRQDTGLYRRVEATTPYAASIGSPIKGSPSIVVDRNDAGLATVNQGALTGSANGDGVLAVTNQTIGAGADGALPWSGDWFGTIARAGGAKMTNIELQLCRRWVAMRTGAAL